jgi:hypothetical protein
MPYTNMPFSHFFITIYYTHISYYAEPLKKIFLFAPFLLHTNTSRHHHHHGRQHLILAIALVSERVCVGKKEFLCSPKGFLSLFM